MVDVLARMRDVADAHNIAPVLQALLKEGLSCAIACDEGGKAHEVIEKEFPALAAHARTYPDAAALCAAPHAPRAYLSSMQAEGIGRAPLAHYRAAGAWAAVVQETPGWRLTGWEAYPDALFGMPGAADIVQQRWERFSGSVFETGMPAYDRVLAYAARTGRRALRAACGIAPETNVLHLAVPAFYAAAFLNMAEEIPHTLRLIVRLHPKAHAEDRAALARFSRRHAALLVPEGAALSPLEALRISDCTAATITSTMLVQASLLGAAPLAYAGEEGMRELAALGGFSRAEEFPYVARGHFALARTKDEWRAALARVFTAAAPPLAPFPLPAQSATAAMVAVVREKLSRE